jgi:hypothetical protein
LGPSSLLPSEFCPDIAFVVAGLGLEVAVVVVVMAGVIDGSGGVTTQEVNIGAV